MLVPDFSRSFATFVTLDHGNNARIQIEATCRYFRPQDTEGELVVLAASCKAEDTYGAGPDLFLVPNYDFCAVFGATEYQIIRSFANCANDRAGVEAGVTLERFAEVQVDMRMTEGDVCVDNSAIVRATLDNLPLVGRTEIADEATGMQAILQYPIKTMNVRPATGQESDIYQVDTGPVLAPDFAATPTLDIRRFEPAFVVYNTLDRAEFVIQKPTGIAPGVFTPHYSETRQLAARNTVISTAGPQGRDTPRLPHGH